MNFILILYFNFPHRYDNIVKVEAILTACEYVDYIEGYEKTHTMYPPMQYQYQI